MILGSTVSVEHFLCVRNVPGTECVVGPKWQSPYPHGTYRVTGKET